MNKNTLFLLLSAFVIGCDSSDINNISGSWITKSCEQAPADLGSHEGKYGKAIYSFTNNEITSIIQFYSGQACTIEADQITIDNPDSSIAFYDLGLVTLQEGLSGHRFSLTFPVQDAPGTFEGFYTVNNDELCFSSTFYFNVYFIGVSGSNDDSIDFGNCLIQQ